MNKARIKFSAGEPPEEETPTVGRTASPEERGREDHGQEGATAHSRPWTVPTSTMWGSHSGYVFTDALK